MNAFRHLPVFLFAICSLGLGCEKIKQKTSEIQEESTLVQNLKEATDKLEPTATSIRQKLADQDREKLAQNLKEINETLKKASTIGDCDALIERFVPQTQKLAGILNTMDAETMAAHQDALIEHLIHLGFIVVKCECGYMLKRFISQAKTMADTPQNHKAKADQNVLNETHIHLALTLVACQSYPGVDEARKLLRDSTPTGTLPTLIRIIDKAADAFAKTQKEEKD